MKFWGESLLLTDQSVEKIFKLYPGSNVMLGDVVVFFQRCSVNRMVAVFKTDSVFC
ncbi:Uncharacterised protein [Escherichia coli]|nr:Uncharacterised protein [Escherichia coli]